MMIHLSRTIALAALLVSPLPALAEPGAYDSPEAAVVALTTALETADRTALLAVFGPEYEDLIFSGDAEKDREIWGGFLRDYQTQHRIDVVDGTRAVVFAGREQWPFPAELIQTDGKWRFDSEGARDEVRFRRIGLNELDVIDLMHRAVEVQARFRAMDHDGVASRNSPQASSAAPAAATACIGLTSREPSKAPSAPILRGPIRMALPSMAPIPNRILTWATTSAFCKSRGRPRQAGLMTTG